MGEKREAYAFEPLDVFCKRKSITQFKYLVVEGSVASSQDQGQRSRSFFFSFLIGEGWLLWKPWDLYGAIAFYISEWPWPLTLSVIAFRFSTISRFHILNILQTLKNLRAVILSRKFRAHRYHGFRQVAIRVHVTNF